MTRQVQKSEWQSVVRRYQRSDTGIAIRQIITTIVPLALVLVAAYWSLALSYWVTLLLIIPAAGLLVRTFIIMHDCAHGSFFPSRTANGVIGWITGIITLTPFATWRHDHALHHASSGDLERRGHGDVDTLTVREYLALSWGARLRYRLFRHPALMFGIGPLHYILRHRIPPRGVSDARLGRSVWTTNAAIAALIVLTCVLVDWRAVALVYAPAMYLAASAGILLFYLQHQFEDTYWRAHAEWDYATAAIRGSSYLKLPAVLRWFTGSIGLHHVHHLGPRIPNYRLLDCHEENALFHSVTVLTLRRSFASLRLMLWDEQRERLVSLRSVQTGS